MSTSVDDPRVAPQIAFARELLDAGKVCWGSCWGIQLATLVAGGEVAANPRGREWGIARAITLTEAAATAPMHEGKPASFDAFIMHLDEVTRLPAGTPLLATNEHTPVQAAIIGSFWVTQYHPEYNLHEMGRLIAARAPALVREGFFVDEARGRSLRRHDEGARRRPRLRPTSAPSSAWVTTSSTPRSARWSCGTGCASSTHVRAPGRVGRGHRRIRPRGPRPASRVIGVVRPP